jgi:hypothetical protein
LEDWTATTYGHERCIEAWSSVLSFQRSVEVIDILQFIRITSKGTNK